jgi:Protein of unknown function (DUF3307)
VTEPVVVIAWLVVAHLVADFVLQTGRIAADKQRDGRRAERALLDHAIGVAACLIPVVLAFGLRGLLFLAVVAFSHVLIDRTKVVLNRRAESKALDIALERYGTLVGSGGLGTAWTPVPAALFIVDQLGHVGVLALGWLILLRDAALTPPWLSVVGTLTRRLNGADIRSISLDLAVGIILVLVNVRAASLLIATLVSPREVSLGEPPVEPREPAATAITASEDPGASGVPHEQTAEPGAPTPPPSATSTRPSPTGAAAGHPAAAASASGPARIGEAIGVLERLLVVVFVLTNSLAAIGFVVAAKTLARFKQLDDRAFAEYYLLGTLASVSIALASSLLAAAALGIAT